MGPTERRREWKEVSFGAGKALTGLAMNQHMSKAAIIIPARWASTRMPGKPLHMLAGKPLVRHVWERCSRVTDVDRIIIATDDMRIAEAAFEFGAEVTLTSDKHPCGTDRLGRGPKNSTDSESSSTFKVMNPSSIPNFLKN